MVTLLLNRELVCRTKLCLLCGFPYIVKDYPEMRNLCKILLRSFKNVGGRDHLYLVLSSEKLMNGDRLQTVYSCSCAHEGALIC